MMTEHDAANEAQQISLENLVVEFAREALRCPRRIRMIEHAMRYFHEGMKVLGTRQDENLRRAERHRQDLEQVYKQLHLISEVQHRQTELIRQHLDEAVVEPLTRRLCAIIDDINTVLDAESGVDQANGERHRLIAFREQLLEVLAGYGVEPISTDHHDAFDPKWMQPKQLCPTDDPSHHGKVAELIRCGFRRNQRILRPAMVAVYRFEPSEPSHTITPTQP